MMTRQRKISDANGELVRTRVSSLSYRNSVPVAGPPGPASTSAHNGLRIPMANQCAKHVTPPKLPQSSRVDDDHDHHGH
jgi:hypothetical protein